jgi:hypothetical protein
LGTALLRRQPSGGLGVAREQEDVPEDGGDPGEKRLADREQPIDERLEVPDVTEMVEQEIARFFTESFGEADEILHVQTALIRFQPR